MARLHIVDCATMAISRTTREPDIQSAVDKVRSTFDAEHCGTKSGRRRIKTMSTLVSRALLAALSLICVLAAVPAAAVPVQLQNGTATFSQPCINSHSPDEAVDGNFSDVDADGVNGWAIAATCVEQTDDATNQTAVWATTTNVTGNGLTFTMYFNHLNPGHLLGRFRFSVTTDDRTTFADGLDTGGDVEANWTVLTHPTVSGPEGMTFTTLADHSILVGEPSPLRASTLSSMRRQFRASRASGSKCLNTPLCLLTGPAFSHAMAISYSQR
jgi:hypothetical protein